MSVAVRLETDMSSWAPVTRHYRVDGGHLAVTVLNMFGTTSTKIFYADETGGAISTVPVLELPDGTTYEQALESMGYTIEDTVTEAPPAQPEPEPQQVEQSVIDILPPEIADMIANAQPPQE